MAPPARYAVVIALVATLGAGAGAALLPDDERPRAARSAGPGCRARHPVVVGPPASPAPPPGPRQDGGEATLAAVGSSSAPTRDEGRAGDLPTEEVSISSTTCGGARRSGSLCWLARHQGPDGGWSSAGFSAGCAGPRCSGGGATVSDATATGLSLLAFLGAGYTHLTRSTYIDAYSREKVCFGKVVKAGLGWLLARQGKDGRLDDDPLGQAVATLALTEAYGLTNAAVYEAPAQRAVERLLASRSPGLGWRLPRAAADDPFVTAWSVMALKSAYISGLEVPRVAFDLARQWLDQAMDPAGTLLGDPPVVRGGSGRPHATTAALALLLRIHIESDQRSTWLAPAARLLVADLPRADEVDVYHWYFATLALFQYQDGGGGDLWKQWKEVLRLAVVPLQRGEADGCAEGSWDPEVDRWGPAAGRVCVTALNTMSLEVYYRYESVFGK